MNRAQRPVPGAWPDSSNLVFPVAPATHILKSPDPDLGQGEIAGTLKPPLSPRLQVLLGLEAHS